MSPTETADLLRQFKKWLRGNKNGPQLDGREISKAIDEAVEMIDRLEAAEKERDALRAEILDAKETVRELFHGAGVANMTITTLLARIREMERQKPVAFRWELKGVDGTFDQYPQLRWREGGNLTKLSRT